VFRIPNYCRPHQTPIFPIDRYRQDYTLLQPSRGLNLTLNRPIRRTAAVAGGIIHVSEQMPRRSTTMRLHHSSQQARRKHSQVIWRGYHRHTPGDIHQRHGHNKRHRQLRFRSNMLRTSATCIWVYLLYHLVRGILDRRRRELFVDHCHQRQILCLNFDGQEASNKF
jgi:hypothetical protein